MSYKTEEIKKGIKFHYIKTQKFKTDLIAIFITLPMSKDTVTKDTLLPAVLKRGTNKKKTQDEISKELEKMYGAVFDCGIEKIGDNHVLKFYMEVLDDAFVPENENLLERALDLVLDIILDPLIENGKFKEEYILNEKNNIKELIESKIDDKDKYALDRCIEEMYKNKPYGLYKYGYVEDLRKIDADNLYQYYKELINSAKFDLFISGDFDEQKTKDVLLNNENIAKLNNRNSEYMINNEQTEKKENLDIKEITDKMDVTQGKLVIGLDVNSNEKDSKFIVSLYNVILGESATSKLFKNVREKESLAYSARSNYVRQKNNIYIRCGIEIKNYKKALEVIKRQLEDIRSGDFTITDLEDAKKYMISGIKGVEDEQDSEITYYIGQELSGNLTTFEEYINKINSVTKEQIEDIASKIEINTIYFLTKLEK